MKQRAVRNRTISITPQEQAKFDKHILPTPDAAQVRMNNIRDKIICGDAFEVLDKLPAGGFDLVFADPPYNIDKKFNSSRFTKRPLEEYEQWLEQWISKIPRLCKKNASIYICGDWRSSTAVHRVCEKYFRVQNRITFEREKGRGSTANWKNCSEDIWFCTISNDYYFDVNSVKINRPVIAPYTDSAGKPKDWRQTHSGRFRATYPSNIWTDITMPFWSMPENTDHPTQKPEKLLAKIILACCPHGGIVLDPFAGVATTAVVAKKLDRHFTCIELDRQYCRLAMKRLELAEDDKSIQGYVNGVFQQRNSRIKTSLQTPGIDCR